MNSAVYVHLLYYLCHLQLSFQLRNGYASSELKWVKILTQCFLIVNEICRMNDGQPFSEMARLTSSSCAHLVCNKVVGPKPNHSLTTSYGHARWPSAMQMQALLWTSTTEWAVRPNSPNPPAYGPAPPRFPNTDRPAWE